ncbi:MAG TPA: UDP-N-acetylglucosamine--N-acetylmuramyl-(pentapeptide) pyrophosphoryl-undecaprenol N-acetylglucosamine transferase [Planctomycetota bacterium]
MPRAADLRFLFVGGGTGGHLAPAVGLAEELEARGHRTLFLGSGRAVEESFLGPERPCRSLHVDGSRLPRAAALAAALPRARRWAREFEPHLVVGLGGLTGAAALAARRGRPLVLLEGNRVVGRSVRFLERWSAATLTLFPETAAVLRGGRCIGPVGRRALRRVASGPAREQLGLDPHAPLLMVAGGSQGARDLNDFAAELAPRLAAAGCQLLALAGAGKAENLRRACAEAGLRARVEESMGDVGLAYSAADFALTRGGAATVAELWLFRLPAAIVPYPHHKDRHQEHNARALEPGVFLIDRLDEVAGERVVECLQQPQVRAAMARHLVEHAPEDGVRAAADFLQELARAEA